MKGYRIPEFEAYLPALRGLPHVTGATIRNGLVRLRTKVGPIALQPEVRQQPLTPAGLNQFLGWDWPDRHLILIPYVPRDLAGELANHHINFVDLAGNCHIDVGGKYLAHVEGRRPPRTGGRGRGLGAAGYRALFALLARPGLVNEPIRTIADAAGIAKTGVAHLLVKLAAEGTVARTTKGRVLVQPERLLERWITGYADHLRPKLVVGRYRTAETDPARLEAQVEKALTGATWAWGGGAAAFRLTKLYRGEATLVHVAEAVPNFPRTLRALPDRNGPLTLAIAPGPLTFEGPLPHVAHPLLVYAELLATGADRERETARQVRERYLSQ